MQWKILQHSKPDDFVIGTGESHTVYEFVEEAFRLVGLEKEKFITINPNLIRVSKTGNLVADISKAKSVLGFEPKVSFNELVGLMVKNDLEIERLTK